MSMVWGIIYFLWSWAVLFLGYYLGNEKKKREETTALSDKDAANVLKTLFDKTVTEIKEYQSAGNKSAALHCAVIADALRKGIDALGGVE